MNSGIIGLLILLGISIVMSAFCHLAIRSFILASIASAFSSAVLFQLVAYIELRHLNAFFLIALVVGAFYALLISIPVGFATRFIRARRTPASTPSRSRRRHLP